MSLSSPSGRAGCLGCLLFRLLLTAHDGAIATEVVAVHEPIAVVVDSVGASGLALLDVRHGLAAGGAPRADGRGTQWRRAAVA